MICATNNLGQQNNTPKKGDIIINPSTQRPVKVGSRTWMNLVKKGVVEGRYQDPNELYEVNEEENHPEILDKKIEEINKTLPNGTQAVRGRGKYAGKIVRRQRKPSTITKAVEVKENIDEIFSDEDLEDMSYEDMERELEQLILSELIGSQDRRKDFSSAKIISKVKRNNFNNEEQYYTQQPDDYDDLTD